MSFRRIMFNIKNNNPKMEYWPMISGLNEIEESCPTLYKNMTPSWWKDVPPFSETGVKSAKNCPAFSDIFNNSYVLRMWCDVTLRFKENQFKWSTSSPFFKMEYHANAQFLDYLPVHARKEIRGVIKFISPWLLKTSKGYSTYQMPMTYDFNEDFTVIPGVIHTDSYHCTNLQVLITSEKEEITIKHGTPLALHFPYKREKFDFEIHNKKDGEGADSLDSKNFLVATSKFINSYRSITREK